MKQRIMRGRFPALTVHYSDDYSAPMHTAYVSVMMDGWDDTMLMRWKITGKQQTAQAYSAIVAKDINALMEILDQYTVTLPAIDEAIVRDAKELSKEADTHDVH
jgi:hypothetical protein